MLGEGPPVVGEGLRWWAGDTDDGRGAWMVGALMDQETSGLDKGNQGNPGRGINLIQYIIILITV